MATAKVFKSGNSQAVRLPKEFRVKSKELEIVKRDDGILLREPYRGIERAFEILADPRTHADPFVRCDLIRALAQSSGPHGMAGGQMMDLMAEHSPFDLPTITRLQQLKTGAIISFCVEAAAIMAHIPPEARTGLHGYARDIGLAFQIADDLLDVEGDAELLGAMLDIANAQEGLDCEGLLAILEPMKVYNREMTLLRADGMHFSFNRRFEGEEVDAAREIALRDLDEYIGVLVTQPEIRARLAEATADFQRTMDDEGLARQQKLRAMDEELTRRLAALSDSTNQ